MYLPVAKVSFFLVGGMPRVMRYYSIVVEKRFLGFIKRYPVLLCVYTVFLLIPFELHSVYTIPVSGTGLDVIRIYIF